MIISKYYNSKEKLLILLIRNRNKNKNYIIKSFSISLDKDIISIFLSLKITNSSIITIMILLQ